MAFRVLVTLHLDQSSPQALERLRDALVKRRLCDWVNGADGSPINLPENHNTYVASVDAAQADEAIKSTLAAVNQAFAECQLTGRIFVAACQAWSWRTATIRTEPKR